MTATCLVENVCYQRNGFDFVPDVKKSSKGGAPGQWTANKAAQMAQEYEKRGGDYEGSPDSKNKPTKGTPEPKEVNREYKR